MSIPENTKKEAVLEHIEKGYTLRDIGYRYNVSRTTIQRWVRAYGEEVEFKPKKIKPVSKRIEGLPDIVKPNKTIKAKDLQELSGSLIKAAIEGLFYQDEYRKYYKKLCASGATIYDIMVASSNGIKLIGEIVKILNTIGIPGYDAENQVISEDLYKLFEIAYIAKKKD